MKKGGSNGEQGDLFAGRKARDEGMDKVSAHNETWIAKCQREAALFAATREFFTGEDIRFHCQEYVGEPRHCNGWGALTCSLVRRKVIEATGEWAQSKEKTSHATKIQIYRRATNL